MSIEPLTLSEKIQDPKVREILEKWKEQLNPLITNYNNGVTKNFNTSASYDVTVANGGVTGVS